MLPDLDFDFTQEPMRVCTIMGEYALKLWDTNRMRDTTWGQTLIAYQFGPKAGSPLFAGVDYSVGMGRCVDDDEAVVGLLSFLTLKEGDTDDDYFKDYTPEQLAWSESRDCEDIACECSMRECDTPRDPWPNFITDVP